jgi:hypothetical protein
MSITVAGTNPIPWWKEPSKDQWLAWIAAWLGWTLALSRTAERRIVRKGFRYMLLGLRDF